MATLAIVDTPDCERSIFQGLFRNLGYNILNIHSPREIQSAGNIQGVHADVIVTQAGNAEKGGRFLVLMKRAETGHVVDMLLFNKTDFLRKVAQGKAALDIALFVRTSSGVPKCGSKGFANTL